MIHLYIFRHTETEWNVAKRMQGRGDSPLTDRGVGLAEDLGERLLEYSFDKVYSSPMQRAVTTAQIALSGRQDIIVDDRLAEMDFGDLDGAHMPTVKETMPDIANALWIRPETYVPLGKGETYLQVMDRTRSFLDALVRENRQFAGPEEPDINIAAFSHSVMLHSFWTVIEDLPVRFFRGRRPVKQCSLTHAVYDGRWHLVCFGD